MTTSFVNRLLRATLVLPQGNFPGTNSNTLVLVGVRMSAKLSCAGNFTNQIELQIYGMRQVDMNAVTVLWGQNGNPSSVVDNAILLLEANDGSGWLQVYEGQIFDAQPDYKSPPDVCLTVTSMQGYAAQISIAPPSSFAGAVDAATLAQQLAGQMGFAFENNGVNATLHTPYFAGTAMDQFRDLAKAAPFDYYFDAQSTLIICPTNQPRQNKSAVVLSPTSGLVGYVSLTRDGGIEFDALFTPAIQLGSAIQIEKSDVPGTNGLWFPKQMTHDLESLRPSGRWFSHIQCLRFPAAIIEGSQSS
jgi:hypothetical protein